MSPSRARYVTACQQLLALGVVVMALVPATRVVSLDVVGVGPGQGRPAHDRGVARPGDGLSEVDMSGYAPRAAALCPGQPAGRGASQHDRRRNRCGPGAAPGSDGAGGAG